MGADDKRKAEEGLEGGPAKKAAATKLAVHPKRVRELRKGAVEGSGPVIYWCGAPSTASARLGLLLSRCWSICGQISLRSSS